MLAELKSDPLALANWDETEEQLFARVFAPRTSLLPSEWAAESRVLSIGPMSGQGYRNDLAPYLDEIMDFVADPWARVGIVMKSARIGYTEGVIGNLLCWTVAEDPAPIALVQPTDDEAEDYSKENVVPMFEANPEVNEKLGELGKRDPNATMDFMKFPGGHLLLLGAVSDTNFRRRSLKRIALDEFDGMRSSTAEGSVLSRTMKRTDDYPDGVTLAGSTPTTEGLSEVAKEFKRGDQRYWMVPCPHCDHEMRLEWGTPESKGGMKWPRETFCAACGTEVGNDLSKCSGCDVVAPAGEKIKVKTVHDHKHPYYQCESCGEAIDESEKAEMVRAGRWVPFNPGAPFPSWHINALISQFAGAAWPKLVWEFIDSRGDPEKEQPFANTVLGLPYAMKSKSIKKGALEGRAESYVGRGGELVEVPDGVGVLTSFTDVQGSYLEFLVRGWGLEQESWDIFHERIQGSPHDSATWAKLAALLTRAYRHESGTHMRISLSMVDAGYLPDRVHGFTKSRERMGVYSSIGDRTGEKKAPALSTISKANAEKAPQYTLGTFRLKARFFNRLGIEQPGPRFMHLRGYTPELCNGFDAEYYAQLLSENRVRTRTKGSRQIKELWIPNRDRNEGLDLHVGNLACYQALGAAVWEKMPELVEAARSGKVATKGRKRGRVRSKGINQ